MLRWKILLILARNSKNDYRYLKTPTYYTNAIIFSVKYEGKSLYLNVTRDNNFNYNYSLIQFMVGKLTNHKHKKYTLVWYTSNNVHHSLAHCEQLHQPGYKRYYQASLSLPLHTPVFLFPRIFHPQQLLLQSWLGLQRWKAPYQIVLEIRNNHWI